MKRIKQTVMALAVLMLGVSTANAQAAFEEGKVTVSAGYGFVNVIQGLFSANVHTSETGYKSANFGPLHFKAEYGISDVVGVGLSVNYVKAGASYQDQSVTGTPYTYEAGYNNLSALLRFNFHIGNHEKVDPYIGTGIGYRTGNWYYESNDPNYTGDEIKGIQPLGFEAVFGLRYYVMENLGLYTEIGMAKSLFQLGVVGSF